MAHEPDWVRKSSLPQYVICVSPWFLSDYASLAWLQGLICPLHVEKGIVPPVLATSHTARVREVLQPAVRDGRQLQDCMAMLMRACSSLQSWPNTWCICQMSFLCTWVCSWPPWQLKLLPWRLPNRDRVGADLRDQAQEWRDDLHPPGVSTGMRSSALRWQHSTIS